MEKSLNTQTVNAFELDDEQVDQVSGGVEIPSIPCNGKSVGLKFGQAAEKPTCFTKSDDCVQLKNGF